MNDARTGKQPMILTRLFPTPVEPVPLEGIYLNHDLRARWNDPARGHARPFVYTDFVVSLDGRIALESRRTRKSVVPGEIANARDWRLFEELGAQADVLLTTDRYVTDLTMGDAKAGLPVNEAAAYQDLRDWRQGQGLTAQPALAVLSETLHLPLKAMEYLIKRHVRVFVATGGDVDVTRARAIEAQGATVLRMAGCGQEVRGQALIQALGQEGFNLIYSTAGPRVLATLLADRMLDRLYLTQVHRILGGDSYDTLVKGQRLCPPADFLLCALYYDEPSEESPGQIFACYAAVR
jgi:riboflavin biosynthesis pyrimidine reductase